MPLSYILKWTIFICMALYLILKFRKFLKMQFFQIRFPLYKGKHQWSDIKDSDSHTCSKCLKPINSIFISGVFCKICHNTAHAICSKKFPIKCKAIHSAHTLSDEHHWVPFNAIMATCSYCKYTFDGVGVTCVWCQRISHCNCKDMGKCDYGKLSNIILKPSAITFQPGKMIARFKNNLTLQNLKGKLKKTPQLHRSNSIIEEKWTFNCSGVTPVIACVNSKSGDLIGESILSSFYRLLNPIQVIDLQNEGTKRLKTLLENFKSAKIIIAGGDGTVHWVLNELIKLKVDFDSKETSFIVAILPLGTGNDLSRHTGWGDTTVSENVAEILEKCLISNELAPAIPIDRWRMQIRRPTKRLKFFKKAIVTDYYTNYFGIGIDAAIVCEFDRIRKKYPTFCSSPVNV